MDSGFAHRQEQLWRSNQFTQPRTAQVKNTAWHHEKFREKATFQRLNCMYNNIHVSSCPRDESSSGSKSRRNKVWFISVRNNCSRAASWFAPRAIFSCSAGRARAFLLLVIHARAIGRAAVSWYGAHARGT